MSNNAATVKGSFREARPLADSEFIQFQSLIFKLAGIHMNSTKRALVAGRLSRRLRHYNLLDYGEYLNIVINDESEQKIFVDLLTTNETYFFREQKHFDFLHHYLQSYHQNHKLRIWSAACSTGEEPYSLAMMLADALEGKEWEILATDINRTVLEAAKAGRYPITAAEKIPRPYLCRYCLQGVREQAGWFLVAEELRARIDFQLLNLNAALPNVGLFDCIFLRNVMIYFNPDTKKQLIARLIRHIRPNGYLIVGHSETVSGVHPKLQLVRPSIYTVRE
jgi:chemotaxis protein methyltransferase CheR